MCNLGNKNVQIYVNQVLFLERRCKWEKLLKFRQERLNLPFNPCCRNGSAYESE